MKTTLNEHFAELKKRLILSVVIYIIFCVFGYYFSYEIINFLLKPMNNIFLERNIYRSLIYTDLTEAFSTKIKASVFLGFIVSIPIFFWQIYAFIAPGLFKKEKKFFILYAGFSTTMFIIGIIMVYSYIMPMAWRFFIDFEDARINLILQPKISEYISLVISMIIAFGIAFQLPVILVILGHIGVIEYKEMIRYRRHATVMIFIFSAIATPPDIMSQIVLALPLMLLYEISILLCYKIQK